MVKAVVGEESQLKSVEDRLSQSGVAAQVGLLIGRLSPALDRGFIFDLIPTPLNDAGEPACSIVENAATDSNTNKKKGSSSKSKSQPQQSDSSSVLFIDKDWVAEHARQVARMLLGGMKVVGLYVWISEGLFKNSTITLCQTMKGVAEAAPSMEESDGDERLLIHISYSPRRWTCRNCSLASNITSSSLRPCDFKMGRVLNSLQKFKCTYNFDLRLPLFSDYKLNIRRFADMLRHGILNQAKELKGAKALIDGKLVIEDDQCATDGLHEIEFLLPFMQDKLEEASSQKEVLGVLVFTGAVCSFAYLNSKEPISQALAEIKEDIITSLQSRLDIICDEADRELELINEGGGEGNHQTLGEMPVLHLDLQLQRNNRGLSFPRRVFVPWLAGTYICDYIQPSETLEVLKDHCVELMSMEVPTDVSNILEPEAEAHSSIRLTTKSFWDMASPILSESDSNNFISEKERNASSSSDQKSTKSSNFNSLAAIVVLIVAVLVGLVLFVVRAS